MNRQPEHEQQLDQIIDSLNAERRPDLQEDAGLAELSEVVRAVKSLGEPAEPSPGFSEKLQSMVRRYSRRRSRARWWLPAVALAAGFLLLMLTTPWAPAERDVVYAMEQAVAALDSYHGVLEKRALNANGEQWLVQRVEIWSEGEKHAVKSEDGTVTVNNGEHRWQVRPEEAVVALLPPLPDPRGFDLRTEAERALEYPHEVVGRENIAGREAIRIEISPPGGLPYDLWIDAETELPLQLRTPMQNALQTTYTFVGFEVNTPVDPTRFRLTPPEGYEVIEENPGQWVDTPAEAAEVARLSPLLPDEAPARILAFADRIILDYGETSVTQRRAEQPFEPSDRAALGRIGGEPVEILGERIRWQQQGLEIQVEGPRRLELARQIAPDLTLPDPEENPATEAQVPVPVDRQVIENTQQQVDGGHSPWWLDPVQVAIAFLRSQQFGQQPDQPAVRYDDLSLESNTGIAAVVSVKVGPVERVYLQRLVRQDDTGIWTVVGYDPRP